MKPEDSPADEAYERDLLLHEIRLLTRVREAAREVWESVPASHDPNDPMVQRHARALNALGAALAQDGRKS